MDWIPAAFVVFKGLMFVTAMFFAIKWHYDQDGKKMNTRALLRTGSKVLVILLLLLGVLMLFTFGLANMLGMDLSL